MAPRGLETLLSPLETAELALKRAMRQDTPLARWMPTYVGWRQSERYVNGRWRVVRRPPRAPSYPD